MQTSSDEVLEEEAAKNATTSEMHWLMCGVVNKESLGLALSACNIN